VKEKTLLPEASSVGTSL